MSCSRGGLLGRHERGTHLRQMGLEGRLTTRLVLAIARAAGSGSIVGVSVSR